MEVFADAKGIDRSLSLTIGKARKCKAKFKIDFIEGEPTELCRELMIRRVLQIDLVWFLMADTSGIVPANNETLQEAFEEINLDGEAFSRARVALLAEIGNFILNVRPEMTEVVEAAISLIRTEITESANNAASLFQSKEVKEAFSKANADANSKALKAISKEFTRLQEQSE